MYAAPMYMPSDFRMGEPDAIDFARHIGVGHLVTSVGDHIESTFIPFLLKTDGEHLVIRAHLSRANSHHTALNGTSALLIVAGPNTYISPTNYPSGVEHGMVVPTWNYAIVHLRGVISHLADQDALLADVSTLSDLHEASNAKPWRVSDAPVPYIEKQLRAIIGIEMRISSVEGKAKLSQNRPEVDRVAVRDALHSGTLRDRQVASLMD